MAYSQAMLVLAKQALIPPTQNPVVVAAYDDRIIKNGPGMHLNLLFSAGGRYVEAASRKGAKLLALGPVAATEAIESYFGEGAARVVILDKSFAIWESPLPGKTQPVPNTADSKAALKLKKLCGNLLKYTDRCVMRRTLSGLV